MTFELQDARTEKFKNLDHLLAFVKEEEKRTVRIPLKKLMKNGARFIGDNGFGIGANNYKFNEISFNALCHLTGTTPNFLIKLKDNELTSDVLTDIFISGSLNKNPETLELVCDEDKQQVIGFVSESYVGYSNKEFICDVFKALENNTDSDASLPSLENFDFENSYSVNTRLHVRLTSTKIMGRIQGKGGQGDDVSKIGVDISNSMAGGHAVRLSYFILRLLCANGLTVPASDGSGRIIHSGSKNRFRQRLWQRVGSLAGSLNNAVKLLEVLSDITYDVFSIAQHVDKHMLFGLVPGIDLETQCIKHINNKDYSKYTDKKERDLHKYIDMIHRIPEIIGREHSLAVFDSQYRDKVSMWDFINLFTEYAKELNTNDRLLVEERAGEFADWISLNKKMFTC